MFPSRTVALSRECPPTRSLHSQFNKRDQYVPPSGQTSQIKEEPEDISRPPMSSSDEEDKEDQKTTIKPEQDSSDSDDNGLPVGNIQKVCFGKTTQPTSSVTGNGRRNTRGQSNGQNPGRSSQSQAPSSSAGSKRSADDTDDGRGKHLKDNYGFAKRSIKPGRIRAPRGKCYGSQKSSSQTSAPKSSAPQEDSPKKRLVRHDIGLDEPASPKSSFRAASMSSSPVGSPAKRGLRKTSPLPALPSTQSPERSKLKTVDLGWADLDEIEEATRHNGATSSDRVQKSGRNLRAKNRKSSPKPVAKVRSPKLAFKIPELEGLDHFGDDVKKALNTHQLGFSEQQGDDGFLSDSPLPDLSDDLDLEETKVSKARCPMCYEPVDPDLLGKHSQNGRMNVRKQEAFCRLHKVKAAEDTRTARGYPVVDWEHLNKRFAKHKYFLEGILVGTTSSYYASLLKETVETGKSRTLFKTNESRTPGYYGPRGLRAMTDLIMRAFPDTLRERAIKDRLVSARTTTGYVQAVLVPELAVHLIMEDMNVTEERAREILQQSKDIGELLQEETKDDVYKSDEED